MKTQPPKLAQWLLRRIAGKAEFEDIQGDIDEVFLQQLKSSGLLVAKLKYWWNTLSVTFSYALKKRKKNADHSIYYHKNSIAMFKNYFKISIRNLTKQRSFTFLNIVGLALGMSVSLLAIGISVSLFRFDEFHEKKERTYQINTFVDDNNERWWYASTFNAMGIHLKETYPFIEDVIRVKSGFNPAVEHHGTTLDYQGYFVDSNFLDVFSFEMIHGNPGTALNEPNTIVITLRKQCSLMQILWIRLSRHKWDLSGLQVF